MSLLTQDVSLYQKRELLTIYQNAFLETCQDTVSIFSHFIMFMFLKNTHDIFILAGICSYYY